MEKLITAALEQAPALTIVAFLLYVFLKAFERTIDKMTKAQDKLIEVIEANHAIMSGWEGQQVQTSTQMIDIAKSLGDTTSELSKIIQLIQFNCPILKKEMK